MDGRHLSWQRGPVEAAAAGGGSEPFTEVMNIKDKEVQARRQSCSSSAASQKPDSYGWLQMELEWPQNSLSFLIAVIPIAYYALVVLIAISTTSLLIATTITAQNLMQFSGVNAKKTVGFNWSTSNRQCIKRRGEH